MMIQIDKEPFQIIIITYIKGKYWAKEVIFEHKSH